MQWRALVRADSGYLMGFADQDGNSMIVWSDCRSTVSRQPVFYSSESDAYEALINWAEQMLVELEANEFWGKNFHIQYTDLGSTVREKENK
jgi:hypothetical protein